MRMPHLCCCQAERETGNDMQREFEERLRKHQVELALVQEALSAAEAQLSTCQEQREMTQTAMQDKEEEVRQLQTRYVAAFNT